MPVGLLHKEEVGYLDVCSLEEQIAFQFFIAWHTTKIQLSNILDKYLWKLPCTVSLRIKKYCQFNWCKSTEDQRHFFWSLSC